MKKSGRLLSILLAVMMVLSLMPTGALAAETPEPLTFWGYKYQNGSWQWVKTTVTVGKGIGQWQYVPLETQLGTVGWVWYQNADKSTTSMKPERVDIVFSVFDGYRNVPGASAEGDEGYLTVTLPGTIANIEDDSCVGDEYYGGKNLAIVLKDEYTFTRYGTYYSNAYNSYEDYENESTDFAKSVFDNDDYQLTWDELWGNKPNYIRVYANIQTRDPDHEVSVVDNDTVQLTVKGYQNAKNVTIASELSDYADVDPSRPMTAVVLDGTDNAFDSASVNFSTSGKTVTASFGDYKLKNDVTYAVRIPIMPTEKALGQALNAAAPYMGRKAIVDNNSTVKFTYDLMSVSGTTKTVEYYERPLFDVPNMNGASLHVKHVWADGAAHDSDVVTVGIYQSGSSTALKTAELKKANDFSGDFSGLGTGNSFVVKVEKITSGGKDVTAKYLTSSEIGESSGQWSRVTPATVQSRRNDNYIYAITYDYNGQTYVLANTGDEMTAVDLASVPVTVSNGKFSVANVASAIGGEDCDSWNHMQWVVMGDGTSAKIYPYNLGTSRFFSADYFSGYKVSMNTSSDGADVTITTSGNTTPFQMFVTGTTTRIYFKQTLIAGDKVEMTQGSGVSAPTNAAQFTFYEYTPTSVSYTLTSTEQAVVEPETYTVTWKNDDGTVLKTETLEAGTTPAYTGVTPTKDPNAQYSYTFSGWSPEVTAVTGDATYTAQFTETVNSYSITWKNDDGSIIDTTTVAYGETPAYTGETPAKAATAQYSYTFKGWSPEVTAVTGNATYTAQFDSSVNNYTITWKNDDGSVIDTTTVAYGETPTHADATKAATAEYSYTFDGWTPAVADVTGDAEYTAKFTAEPKSYTVTYKVDGEIFGDVETVAYGTALAAREAPSKTGYTFSGWSAVPATMPAHDVVVEGSFTVNQYTIKFVNDDGTVLQSSEVAYGTTPAYTGATPTKTADADGTTYTFKGWDQEIVSVTGEATYTATFEAKAPTANTVKLNVTNYTKAGATVTVNGVSETDKDVSFDVNANASVTVSVSADKACAVGLQNADGTYTRLKATKSGNSYSFTIAVDDANVSLIVGYKGDINTDGKFNMKDAQYFLQTCVSIQNPNAMQRFIGDVFQVEKNVINMKDASWAMKATVGLETADWDL